MNAKNTIKLLNGAQLSGIDNINESLETHYLIYRIDNIENNTFYIGQHRTHNPYDLYMGSGKILNDQYEKYPMSCYIKTILFDLNDGDELNAKELELMPEISCHHHNPLCLNIVEGGGNCILSGELHGMYGKNPYENLTEEELNRIIELKRKQSTELWKNPIYVKRVKDSLKIALNTPEYKEKRSKLSSGERNGMFGKSLHDLISEEEINKWKQNLKKTSKLKKENNYKWMYNSITGKNSYVNPNQQQEYLDNGWKFGRKVSKHKKHKSNFKKRIRIYKENNQLLVYRDEIQSYLDNGWNIVQYGKKHKQ